MLPCEGEESTLPEYLRDRPIGLVFGFLFAVSMARGQATYALAAWMSGQAGRRPALAKWASGPGVARGVAATRRWGVAAIPLAYLTIGLQTLIFAAAGVVRLRWRVFTLAQIPGALAWAAIYSTIGWAAWEAALAALAGEAWATVLLPAAGAALLVVVVTRAVRRSLAAKATPDVPPTPAGSASPPPTEPAEPSASA
ncbi:MAG: hypothetical protein IPK24_04830 [Kineosporiaceae bacterium]|nr:hypothetical protein [Kineosporiaceae bacterium]